MTPINFDRIIGLTMWYVPEIILSITAVVIIIFSLVNFTKGWAFYAAIAGVILQLIIIPGYIVTGETLYAVFQMVMSFAALITIILSGRHQRMEYYFFILSLLIGAEILVKVYDFFTIILSFEVISISSYVLTAGLNPEKNRAEAAWKFFIYGSVATAFMIFGMTYWYGANGTLWFERGEVNSYLLNIGIVMMFAGFFFKTTAAPFHLWAPDVYEATPAPLVAYFSVVPKIAALGLIAKLTGYIAFDAFIAGVAIISLVIGTLGALSQTDARRMMAYSSVAQAGIMLAAISARGFYVLEFYVIVFAAMNYAAFILIGTKEKTAFTEFSGIGYTHTFAAVAGTLALVSLVGIPPVAGFMGKLFVFTEVWRAYSGGENFIFLILFITGLIATIASLYFYLKIPFFAFFRRSTESNPTKIPLLTNLLLLILVSILLALFIAPGLVDGLSY